jgi:hypothetical protein
MSYKKDESLFNREQKMPEIIQHTINYTLEELKQMVKPSTYEYVTIFNGLPVHQIRDVDCLSGEVFRKYPQKQYRRSQ